MRAWWVMAGLALVGCDDGGTRTAVELRFAAKVGAQELSCGARYEGLGASASAARVADLRLYLSGVRVLDEAGRAWPVSLEQDGLWQRAGVALLDFEDKTGTCVNGTEPTHLVVRGTHEASEVAGVAFDLGVPFELNHADVATAPSPLNLSGLFWSWQGGYKFLRLDLAVEGDAGEVGFNVHLGSTGCTLDPATTRVGSCARPNRGEVVLEGFDPSADTVVLDLAALLAGIDLEADGGGAPGCMAEADDPECAPIFERLGVDLETGEPRAGQSAFRVE